MPTFAMVDEITQVVPVRELEEALARRGLFARLEAVSLADLVQLGGQRPGRAVYRVTSGALVGHLYFDAGQLHAAELGAQTGLDALAQMLRFETGAFETSEGSWPSEGNIELDPAAALLRASSSPPPPRRSRPSSPGLVRSEPAGAPLPPARFVVRTLDSMGVDESPLSGRHDPLLGALARDVHEHARRFGDVLGLTHLDSARLINDLWIFLLFHESNPERISAVIGARGNIGDPAADLRDEPQRAWRPLPRSLSELSAADGSVVGFVAGPKGELHASRSFAGHTESRIVLAARLAAGLLGCSDLAGFAAVAGELRFARRRVVLRRAGDVLIGLVAVSTVPWPWLRRAARELCVSKM
jgi:uncharacterized protein DUF4388